MAAFNSTGMHNADAEGILRWLSDKDVRRERFMWKSRMFWIDSFMKHEPIRKLLTDNLPEKFFQLVKPLAISVTDEKSARQEILLEGDLHEAVLASMSISGIWPPVKIGGQLYSDGGTTANLPMPGNVAEYDEVYLLISKRPIDYKKTRGLLTRWMRNVDIMFEDQMRETIELARSTCKVVRVVWPETTVPNGSLHFDHTLIDDAYVLSQAIIGEGDF